MLTEEQEQKIRDALDGAFKIKGNTFYDLIVAGIKAYDEMKGVEEVKAAAKDSGNDDDCYVVFRPDDKRGSEMWVFDSIRDMSAKLFEKYNESTYQGSVAIGDGTISFSNMENAQEVYLVKSEEGCYRISGSIGFCDCKTFKKV